MADIHLHVHLIPDAAEARIAALEAQGAELMTRQDEMDAALDQIDAATNEIAADLLDLEAKLLAAGVPQALVDRLKSSASRLQQIAADHGVPVPPPAPLPPTA